MTERAPGSTPGSTYHFTIVLAIYLRRPPSQKLLNWENGRIFGYFCILWWGQRRGRKVFSIDWKSSLLAFIGTYQLVDSFWFDGAIVFGEAYWYEVWMFGRVKCEYTCFFHLNSRSCYRSIWSQYNERRHCACVSRVYMSSFAGRISVRCLPSLLLHMSTDRWTTNKCIDKRSATGW